MLGRTLLADVLKEQLPSELRSAFQQSFHVTAATAIESVYRSPQPNRWLASFVPFIADHRTHDAIQQLLSSQFRAFFRRNLSSYGNRDLPVHFSGSVAWYFQPELTAAAQAEGFTVGTVLRNPIPGLVAYHHSTPC